MEFIFDKFDEYVLISDIHGKIIFCNDKLLNKLGYLNEEIISLNISEILTNIDIAIDSILNKISDLEVTLNFITKKNELLHVCSKIRTTDFKGDKAIFIISKEIDSRKYTMEHLEMVLDNMEYGAFIKDRKGKYLYANKAFAKVAMCSRDEVIGSYDIDHWEKRLSDGYARTDKEVLECKKARLFNEITNVNGEDLWYESYKAPIYNEDGTPKCVVGIVRNINLEKTVKEELYENYNQITSLSSLKENKAESADMHKLLNNIGHKVLNGLEADGLSILVYDKEKNGLVPYIKLKHSIKVLEKVDIVPFDYSIFEESINKQEWQGLKTKEELLKDNPIKDMLNLQDIEYIGSYYIKLRDEILGNISVTYKKGNVPQSNRDDFMKSICNKIAMIIKNCKLSEEVKVENSKRKSTEKELELYLNVAVDLIAVIGNDGYFKKVSSSWVDVLGWSEEELLMNNCRKFIHPDDYEIVMKVRENRKNTDEIFRLDVRYMCKDGGYVWLDWSSKYIEKEDLFISTARNITQQKTIEEQKRKLEETVQLESIKNEFFANISHEFKTPLNIILGTMQLTKRNIEKNRVNIDRLSRHTNIIKQNSYRLLRLVNNLIDISRIDIGYYNLQQSNQNIINIIEEITLSVAYYVENKKINLIFDTDIEELIVSCDPDKIERVLLNLLSNAIKYTPEYGTINVNISHDAENVIVAVKDTGTGIPKEKIDIIFDRFGQANSMLSRRCEGSGIGLSLVKSILEMHGGNIQVSSELGNGSEFVFNIPIKVLDEEVMVNSDYDNKEYLIEKCHIEFSDIYS